MDMISAVKFYFPVSAEGGEIYNTYGPAENGLWPITDEHGDVVCYCPTWEVSTSLADLLNDAYALDRDIVVEISA